MRRSLAGLADSLGSIVSAGLAAVIPIGILSGAGSIYGVERAGVVSVCLAFAAYAAQVLSALCVEAPLFGGGRRADLPTVVFAAGFLGCLLWGLGVTGSEVSVLGLFLMIPALECARASAVLQGGWRRELIVGALLAIGVVWVLVSRSPVALHIGVAAAVAAAMVIRMPRRLTRFPVPKGNQWWVVLETAIIGIAQPFAMSLAYGGLGSAAAAGLKFTLSTVNIISPVLYFLRLRLLARSSVRDIALASTLLTAGCAAMILAQVLGVFHVVFGPGWGVVSTSMLLIGFAWKALATGTTIPFASLRRGGHGVAVLVVRAVTTGLYIVMTVVAVYSLGAVTAVLVAFASVEGLSWLIYEAVDRQLRRNRAETLPKGDDIG